MIGRYLVKIIIIFSPMNLLSGVVRRKFYPPPSPPFERVWPYCMIIQLSASTTRKTAYIIHWDSFEIFAGKEKGVGGGGSHISCLTIRWINFNDIFILFLKRYLHTSVHPYDRIAVCSKCVRCPINVRSISLIGALIFFSCTVSRLQFGHS